VQQPFSGRRHDGPSSVQAAVPAAAKRVAPISQRAIMNDPGNFQPDFFDAALRCEARTDGDTPLREAALRQTLGVLRRRRRMRKCLWALSLAGCYVAGLATMELRPTAAPATQTPPDAVAIVKQDAPPPAPKIVAKLTPAEAARQEADRCLLELGDVKEAIRQYNRYLKLAPAQQLAISPEHDSWLLMAMKDAKLKEIGQ
jgi:hypothetical protein